jgi:hypothetical protein
MFNEDTDHGVIEEGARYDHDISLFKLDLGWVVAAGTVESKQYLGGCVVSWALFKSSSWVEEVHVFGGFNRDTDSTLESESMERFWEFRELERPHASKKPPSLKQFTSSSSSIKLP